MRSAVEGPLFNKMVMRCGKNRDLYIYVRPTFITSGHFAVSLSIAAAYGAYAVATAIAVGVVHYGTPIAEDIGDKLGQLLNEARRTNEDRPRSNPIDGDPGSIGKIDTKQGEPKQDRHYGTDGFPDKDIDYDHVHNGLQPHAHDWGRPDEGGRPNNKDRKEGRPLTKDENAASRAGKPDKSKSDQSKDSNSKSDKGGGGNNDVSNNGDKE